MKSTIKKLLLLSVMLFPMISYAQPIITSSIYPPDGTMIDLVQCKFSDIQENNVGEDVIWDFSGLESNSNTYSLLFEESSESPYDTLFPNANKVVRYIQGQDTLYTYNSLNDIELAQVGVVIPEPFNIILDYSDGETILKFPVTYEDSWVDSLAFILNSGTELKGSITTVMDGYGTLILPNGTYDNVIRTHEIWSVPGWNSESHKYRYYSPDFYYELLSFIRGDSDRYYQSNPIPIATTSIEERYNSNNVIISPNPVFNNLDLKIVLETENLVDIEVLSIDGQKLISESGVQFIRGVYYLSLNDILKSGFYIIRIAGDGFSYSKKVLVH